MLSLFKRTFYLTFALLWPGIGQAEDVSVEIVLAQFPPYLTLDAMGQPSGPVAELVELLFADLEQPYSLRELPPARAGKRLYSGEAVLTIASGGNPGLTRIARQGQQPLLAMTLNIYRKPDTPAIASLADLAGKRVIFVTAYSYGNTDAQLASNQPPTQRIDANTHESALNMLLYGRADYLLDYAEPLREQISRLPAQSLMADHIAEINMYWYLSRQHPRSELLEQLDQATIARQADGSIDRILLAAQPAN